MANGPAVEVLADADCQGPGAQTGGRVVTPSHRKFMRNPPEWYEEMRERQRRAHSSRRIRVEHGIGHLKNWRALARTFGLSGSSFTLTSRVRLRLGSVSALVSTADSPHERTSWLSCGGCGGGSVSTNRLVRASSRALGSWYPDAHYPGGKGCFEAGAAFTVTVTALDPRQWTAVSEGRHDVLLPYRAGRGRIRWCGCS